MTEIIEILNDCSDEQIKVEEIPIMQSMIGGLIKIYNTKKVMLND